MQKSHALLEYFYVCATPSVATEMCLQIAQRCIHQSLAFIS